MSSAGQVGGEDSPGSRFRRNVSSNPKPLGSPGPDRLQRGRIRIHDGTVKMLFHPREITYSCTLPSPCKSDKPRLT